MNRPRPLMFLNFPQVKRKSLDRVDASQVSPQLPLRIAQNQALNHIHHAAKVLADSMPHIAEVDRQLYTSIIGGLCTLERHLAEISQS